MRVMLLLAVLAFFWPAWVPVLAEGAFFREYWAEWDERISNHPGRLRVNDTEITLHPSYGRRSEGRANGLMLLTVPEISLRKLAGYSIEGVFEGVELMLVAIVYLGLAHVQHRGKNVRVELLLTRVPFKVRQALEAFTMLLAVAFFGVALWMTGKEAWASWLIKETTFLPAALPIYVARGIITLGFFFLWLRLLIQIGERIYNLIGKSGDKSASI